MLDPNNIPADNTKVKLKIVGYFGNLVNVFGIIIGEPFQHGFHSPSGWGLYDISNHGYPCYPAYKVKFKPTRKKHITIIDLEDIKEIQII